MPSEALTKVRTLRQVKSSLDVARKQRLRTTNSLDRATEQMRYLESPSDIGLHRILDRERKRFAAQEAAVDRSRKRLLEFREKLAQTINRNRALTELRLELQRGRSEGNNCLPPKAERRKPEQNMRQVRLRY